MKEKRYRIAVVLANMSDDYAHETLLGIMEQADKLPWELYVFNTYVHPDETLKHNIGEYNLYSLIRYKEFDGIILLANMIPGKNAFAQIVENIRNSKVPTVSIDADLDGFCRVSVENYSGMKQVVEHLIECHHMTKIDYISGLDFNSDSIERLAAYCDALREHGIPVEESRIFKGDFMEHTGRLYAQKILESGELPQAIVCATDNLAMGVRSVLNEHGIRIPDQVALAGFDNDFGARYYSPRLTTVDRNQRMVGRESVKKLYRYFSEGEALESELFASTPIFAESCGCKSRADEKDRPAGLKYMGMSGDYKKYLYESQRMIENLNDSATFAELLEALKQCVKQLECDRFYLCLDKTLVENMEFVSGSHGRGTFSDEYAVTGYPEIMSVPLAYERGQYKTCADFPSSRMFPRIEFGEGDQRILFFSPLHFKERCIGYIIIGKSGFVLDSSLFGTWMCNLANSLDNLRKQVRLQRLLEHLDGMYVKDLLTGLYNRFGFARYAGESFQRCIREQKSFLALFVDMDGLKRINDEYGHKMGDIAIRAVADSLKQSCGGNEICARFGGDEYVVYAEGFSREDADAFCRRFDAQIRLCNEKLQLPFRIEVSYGYELVCPREGDVIDKYIDMADNRMYENKKQKKAERRS